MTFLHIKRQFTAEIRKKVTMETLRARPRRTNAGFTLEDLQPDHKGAEEAFTIISLI